MACEAVLGNAIPGNDAFLVEVIVPSPKYFKTCETPPAELVQMYDCLPDDASPTDAVPGFLRAIAEVWEAAIRKRKKAEIASGKLSEMTATVPTTSKEPSITIANHPILTFWTTSTLVVALPNWHIGVDKNLLSKSHAFHSKIEEHARDHNNSDSELSSVIRNI